jgi:hypothetical protein
MQGRSFLVYTSLHIHSKFGGQLIIDTLNIDTVFLHQIKHTLVLNELGKTFYTVYSKTQVNARFGRYGDRLLHVSL